MKSKTKKKMCKTASHGTSKTPHPGCRGFQSGYAAAVRLSSSPCWVLHMFVVKSQMCVFQLQSKLFPNHSKSFQLANSTLNGFSSRSCLSRAKNLNPHILTETCSQAECQRHLPQKVIQMHIMQSDAIGCNGTNTATLPMLSIRITTAVSKKKHLCLNRVTWINQSSSAKQKMA